jgi:putative ABC transport system permease protein
MNKLFGVPLSTIALVMAILFAICLMAVVVIWLSNRTMFRIGLRNIPRRRGQSLLIVLGLMLGTLIITASFATGDSLSYSTTKATYDTLRRIDLVINFQGTNTLAGATAVYVPQSGVEMLQQRFQSDPNIERFTGMLVEQLPALDTRTNLAKPNVFVVGIDPAQISAIGGLTLASGGKADLQQLTGNNVFLNQDAADRLDAKAGDTLTLFVNGSQQQVRVAGIVKNELASGDFDNGPNRSGGLAAPLPLVQQMTGHAGQVNFVAVTLRGGVRGSVQRSAAAAKTLDAYFATGQAQQAFSLGSATPRTYEIKRKNLDSAELFGNIITTFFLVLGLFSIAAGILLIFMIFVMLAAERKSEMGMARAIGARRIHLVQAFVAEGMAYDILAGIVGTILGVAIAFALVIGGLKLILGSVSNLFAAHVTWASLITSYCLGVVLTFITVVVSSFRVSRLNIVSAIRGTPADETRARRGRFSIWWTLLGIVLLIIPPLGLIVLLRKGFGLPWFWVFVPLGIVVSLLFLPLARSTGQVFFFSAAVSFLVLCAAAIARRFGVSSRATWTTAGLLLALYWLTPNDLGHTLLGKKLTGGIEMFVLSGIMIVSALTLVIVFNANLLERLFVGGGDGHAYRVPGVVAALALACVIAGLVLGDRGGGLGQLLYLLAALFVGVFLLTVAAIRYPRLAPALKMAIAYPVANRFRTGMTIAMFSLIIFSLTVMSVLNSNFTQILLGSDARAGWDVIVSLNRNNPIPDLLQALRGTGQVDTGKIVSDGRVSDLDGLQQVRQEGVEGAALKPFPVLAGDESFFGNNTARLQARATGYASDEDVWRAIMPGSGLAVITSDALPQQGNFGPSIDAFTLKGVTATQKSFAPITVEIRNPVTGATAKATIIGIVSAKVPAGILDGLYTDARTFAAVFGEPRFLTYYLRLRPGTNSDRYAKAIESSLVSQGVQAFSIQKQIDEAQAQSIGFSRLFQGFLALGLLVGIAAIGVIGFRSVVERQQQIGMLRAIGYQRGTIALSFVLESSFVAVMGIVAGVAGGAILSRNLLNSDRFTSGTKIAFSIPWLDVIVFVVVAYLFALLMTYWPSRSASRVAVAEALRYE